MRPRAVVDEPADHFDIPLAQPLEPFVGPREIELIRSLRGDGFPQHRIADGSDPEPCNQVDIADSIAMSGLSRLVAPLVADPRDGALHAPPKLERKCLDHP